MYRKLCPLCGTRHRSFQTGGASYPVLRDLKVIGAGRRVNALCPTCGSTDRERLVYLYLLNCTGIFSMENSELRLLHVAPERNLESRFRQLALREYTTCDLTRNDVDREYDITSVPVPDGSYDVVICNHVLEHVQNANQALLEIFRILVEGGWAVLQVPISPVLPGTIEDSETESPEERAWKFGQTDHCRIFGEDYPVKLASAGFTVVIFDWTKAGRRFGGPMNRFALNRQERVYIGRRASV